MAGCCERDGGHKTSVNRLVEGFPGRNGRPTVISGEATARGALERRNCGGNCSETEESSDFEGVEGQHHDLCSTSYSVAGDERRINFSVCTLFTEHADIPSSNTCSFKLVRTNAGETPAWTRGTPRPL